MAGNTEQNGHTVKIPTHHVVKLKAGQKPGFLLLYSYMLVENIFNLVHGKQEDQLSSSFGFILKNNKPILKKFLDHIGIRLTDKELKTVDIETQTTYNSGESRIDLHLLVPNRFLIFLESFICN